MTNFLFFVLALLSAQSEKSLQDTPFVATIIMPQPPSPNTGYEHWDAYISRYKSIACAISSETGIPASILLAQGILEGDAGRAQVVKQANNHFCVKCKRTCRRPGHCVVWRDDHPDDRFLVFNSDEDAFNHQSVLLVSNRYRFLRCQYGDDQDGWCQGLQDPGYATTKSYALILRSIIKSADLHEYDIYATRKGPYPSKPRTGCIERTWSSGH